MSAAHFFVGGLSTALLCAFGVPARADWLSGPSRAISSADSASPNAPVTGYEYGPRAKASLGGDWAVYSSGSALRSVRIGGSALVAFEDAEAHAAVPSQMLRSDFSLSAAWAFSSSRWLAEAPRFELTLTAGKQTATTVSDFVLRDRYRSDDVPFGGGGGFLGLDFAILRLLSPRVEHEARLGARAYTNAFPDLVGAHVASDAVADALHEGGEYLVWGELGVRVHALPRLDPLARLYFDLIFPHDDSAKTLALARLMVGAAIPGQSYELTPFTAIEVGHAEGVAINRTELRWSFGVRLYAR